MPRRRRGQTIDAGDAAIISQLARDGRMPNVAIAQAVGLGETAVRRRLERLVRANALRVGAQLDPETFGYVVHVVLEISVDSGRAEEIGERLARGDYVEYTAICVGQYDLIVGASFRTNAEMMDFIAKHVRTIRGIRSCRVFPLSAVLKRHYEWNPLALGQVKAHPEAKAARRRPKLGDVAAKAPSARAGASPRRRRPRR